MPFFVAPLLLNFFISWAPPAFSLPCWPLLQKAEATFTLGKSNLELDDYLLELDDFKTTKPWMRTHKALEALSSIPQKQTLKRLIIVLAFVDSFSSTETETLADLISSAGNFEFKHARRLLPFHRSSWTLKSSGSTIRVSTDGLSTQQDLLEFALGLATSLHELKFHQTLWPWRKGFNSFPVCIGTPQTECAEEAEPNQPVYSKWVPSTVQKVFGRLNPPGKFANQVISHLVTIEDKIYRLTKLFGKIDPAFKSNFSEKDTFATFHPSSLVAPLLSLSVAASVDYYIHDTFTSLTTAFGWVSTLQLLGFYNLFGGHRLNEADAQAMPIQERHDQYDQTFRNRFRIYWFSSNIFRAFIILFLAHTAPEIPRAIVQAPAAIEGAVEVVSDLLGIVNNSDEFFDTFDKNYEQNLARQVIHDQQSWTQSIADLQAKLKIDPENSRLSKELSWIQRQLDLSLSKYGDRR